MGAVTDMVSDESIILERKQAIYQSIDEKYRIHGEKFDKQQYSHIYYMRLDRLREALKSIIPKLKPQIPVQSILGLEKDKECIIVGTIYKHMKLKPSILDEYSKERSVVPLVKPHNFMHPDDNLVLEDDSGRVKLSGAMLNPSVFVTGVVMALHGMETSGGEFLVQDIVEADLPPQIEIPLDSREDKYVVLISGLNVGSSNFNPLQFQLLVDHITGHLGDENEQHIASQIVRLVIAGNSLEISQAILAGQNIAPKDHAKICDPSKELDILITQIAATMPVDIMPGSNDPANFFLPQQPLHKCLFPGASVYNTFVTCTNPHEFELDGIRFLGTSGQNIHDLDKYFAAKNRLEFMERTLRWRHLAPSAPNTLGCYPYKAKDPFVVESCPRVYFVGNQDKYEICTIQDMSRKRPPSTAAGASASGTTDLRPKATLITKKAEGFELDPSDYILSISRKAYMSRMSGCWPRWDDIPGHLKNAIWADLMAAVAVDEQEIQIFRNYWDKKMRKNYRCTLSVIKSKRKKPDWMSTVIYADFLQLWDTPAVKEISARNSANRNKNPVIHRGGSKPFSEYRKKLAKQKKREPTFAEVFRRTHAIEHTDDDGVVSYTWADSKSRSVMEKYEAEEARVLQSTGREELTVEEQDMIFDVVSDPPIRNRQYGYGNQEPIIRDPRTKKR